MNSYHLEPTRISVTSNKNFNLPKSLAGLLQPIVHCIKESRFPVKLKTPNQKQEALQSFHAFSLYEDNDNIF